MYFFVATCFTRFVTQSLGPVSWRILFFYSTGAIFFLQTVFDWICWNFELVRLGISPEGSLSLTKRYFLEICCHFLWGQANDRFKDFPEGFF